MQDIHNRTTQANAYENCLNNIQLLVKANVDVGIQFVALRENTINLEAFVNWAEELGISSFTMQNALGGPWCFNQDFFSIGLIPNEYSLVMDRLKNLRHTSSLEIFIEQFPHERMNNEKYYDGLNKGMKMRAFSTCSAGKTAIQVSPKGDLSPCPHLVGYSEYS